MLSDKTPLQMLVGKHPKKPLQIVVAQDWQAALSYMGVYLEEKKRLQVQRRPKTGEAKRMVKGIATLLAAFQVYLLRLAVWVTCAWLGKT